MGKETTWKRKYVNRRTINILLYWLIKKKFIMKKEKQKRRKAELRACLFPILENSFLILKTRKKNGLMNSF